MEEMPGLDTSPPGRYVVGLVKGMMSEVLRRGLHARDFLTFYLMFRQASDDER